MLLLGQRAITDAPTVIIAAVTLILLGARRIPEPVIIALAGVAGILIQ